MQSHHTKEMQNEPGDELMYPNMESRPDVKPLHNHD